MKETAFSNDGNFRPVMFKAIYIYMYTLKCRHEAIN